jgi:hypothetical protein
MMHSVGFAVKIQLPELFAVWTRNAVDGMFCGGLKCSLAPGTVKDSSVGIACKQELRCTAVVRLDIYNQWSSYRC